MKKKLIIFDLDGTLADTVADLNAGINYALVKNGYEPKPIEHTKKAIGNGISKTIYRSLPDNVSTSEHKKVFDDFRLFYKNHYLDNTLPYLNMDKVLLELKSRGYLLAVATNKLEEIAIKMVNHFYPHIFDLISGDNQLRNKKPDPQIINEIISSLNVNKEDVIYVGDSEVDLETANNANIDLILVDYGFHRNDEFYNINAKHVKNPLDLLDII